ncbi:MAG: aspartate aminotransferase family protein, partial [Cytophagia bacterium]|nr:aspartate aminotransferase family protein [Cytophagia bacterium]
SDTNLFGKYFQNMLELGVYMAPSQFEAMFISNAVDKNITETILVASHQSLKKSIQ